MDLILIPQALMIFYGGLVLSCGGVLGFIVGRNVRRRIPPPDPGESLERRVSVLERVALRNVRVLKRTAIYVVSRRLDVCPHPDRAAGLRNRVASYVAAARRG